jgi:hypothetical protein
LNIPRRTQAERDGIAADAEAEARPRATSATAHPAAANEISWSAMTRLICALIAALTLLGVSFAAPADKEVLAALEAWRQATLNKDPAALDKILHKDLTYTHSSGLEQNKADQLKAVADPKAKPQAIELSNTTVRQYGNTAIVKTNMTTGGASATHLLLLLVFVKTPEGWQMVARQATRVDK